MYFWRIERLKAELVARPLSDRDVLPYLVVSAALASVVYIFPATMLNIWDGLGVAWSVALAVFGTIYIFFQNGGAEGRNLLQRYFAVGWVVALRMLVVVVPVLAAFLATLLAIGVEMDVNTTWYDFLLFAIIESVFYLRFGHHVKDVAQRARLA